jgi:hypothetical protein
MGWRGRWGLLIVETISLIRPEHLDKGGNFSRASVSAMRVVAFTGSRLPPFLQDTSPGSATPSTSGRLRDAIYVVVESLKIFDTMGNR